MINPGMTGVQESEVTPNLKNKIEESRAERDLFERKHQCQVHGVPFVPTKDEKDVLDRLEAQVPKPVSKEQPDRWERHAMARELERQQETNPITRDPVGAKRVADRIEELKAS